MGFLALVCSVHAFAFDADITVKPRLEGAYNSSFNDDNYGLGLSSLYTFMEGEIADGLSYFAQMHFLSNTPEDLYKYDEPCVYGTWLDMAYLTYERNFWGVDLGKVYLNFGGMANEYDDVDLYSGLIPYNWYEFNGYQYGLTLRLTPAENHSLEAQLTTSPLMYDFSDKLLGYGLCWRGEMGNFSTAWAVNGFNSLAEADDEESDSSDKETNINIGLGNRYDFNDRWGVELDAYVHAYDCDFDDFTCSDFYLTGCYNSESKIAAKALVGLRCKKAVTVGAVLEYYPIESLRIHTSLSYCDVDNLSDYHREEYYNNSFEASIGVTYTFDFHLGK